MTAPQITAVSLAIFGHLFASAAEEMGVTLGRAAFSPNIKERLDFSCAAFFGDGRLLAQAAHIPVHLGAMPASVRAALDHCRPLEPGDIVILNDPYLGGNHLPDITLVSPVFFEASPALHASPAFLVASRAHHADVGGMSPGSMPLSTELYQEGIIIPPIKLVAAGRRNDAVWQLILRNVRTPTEREGDLAAQVAAHEVGTRRLVEIVARYGLAEVNAHAEALLDYTQRLTRAAIWRIPDGRYSFSDYLDDDGQSVEPVRIQANLVIRGQHFEVDFEGTSPAVNGNLNAVPAIAVSAVAYCLRCVALALLEMEIPMNEGAIAPLEVRVPEGSLLHPFPPHAVAAGNVETSQRIVDVLFGALAQALPDLVPAASQGTMNNLTIGGRSTVSAENGRAFAYYETIGGGAGAGPKSPGADGVHVHMSNTRNTPLEALEYAFPLRAIEYSLRHGSGGGGRQRGGDGLVRSLQFMTPATVTLTTERRRIPPYGMHGGKPGATGRNLLVRAGRTSELPGKITLDLEAGDLLRVETPGGGGWGVEEPAHKLDGPTGRQYTIDAAG